MTSFTSARCFFADPKPLFRNMRFLCYLFLGCFLPSLLVAQMSQDDGAIRYGNEWIDYTTDYLKLQVAADGLYRISPATLANAGMPLSADQQNLYELYHNGRTVPIEVSERGILFIGQKNRSTMDRFLFAQPDKMLLNTRYSLYSDTATYYLRLRATPGTNFFVAPVIETAITTATSILREETVVFGNKHSKEFFRSSGASIYYSRYDHVEGFGSLGNNDLLSTNGNTTSTAKLILPAANGEAARIEVRFGLGFDRHQQELRIDDTPLWSVEAPPWSIHQPTVTFRPTAEQATLTLQGSAGDRDKANIAWARVVYPAQPVADTSLRSFIVPASRTAVRITLTDLGADAGAVQVYSAGNAARLSASVANGRATLVFPPSGRDQRYWLAPSRQLTPRSESRFRFRPTLPADRRSNYLLLTSRRLHGPGVEALAAYRRSPAGGSHRVHVVDVEDLYDEFGYGIPNHPMAVRNYLAAAFNVAPELRYLFLVGKGREYFDVRTPEALADARETFFLPSFGYPASDNLLSAPLGSIVPRLSTGRLAAINDTEVALYLGKLQGVERQVSLGEQTIADRAWMKTILHLGGGVTPGEQSSIRRGLQQMAQTSEKSDMSSRTTSFFRTSTEPIEESLTEGIFNTINNGTAMITFFGHSSSQSFDFSIDNPNNYNNKDRYPFILSLGCYSGDAFTRQRSISERFIFLPDRAAVAMAASKGVGYITALRVFADSLYHVAGTEQYGQGLGDILRSNIEKFANTRNFTIAILLEQFSLNGDPAYRLHPQPGPDFLVDATSVRFSPDVVPAQEQTFTMNFDLVNIGSNYRDSVTLRFQQQLPDGRLIELQQLQVAPEDYTTPVTAVLPNPGLVAVGNNRILVTVDVTNRVQELPAPAAENNNRLMTGGQPGIPLTFIANTARAAWPPSFAVVGGPVELVATTTDALAPERPYRLEVATSRDFSTPLLRTDLVRQGGVIRYAPTFTPTDSTTYYWRISPDSSTTDGAGFIWSESSFTWLASQAPDTTGWAMQHPGQTSAGNFENINPGPDRSAWNFTRTITDLTIVNAPFRSRQMPRFVRSGQTINSPFSWRTRRGINVLVIDSTDFTRWYLNPGDGQYGSVPHNGNFPFTSTWAFNTFQPAAREGLIDFIDNAIEPGKYVMLYTAQRGNNIEYFNDGWLTDSTRLGRTLFDVLEDQGALQVRNIASLGSVPYVFAFQKDMGRLGEALALTPNDTVTMQTAVFSNWAEGSWDSGSIGPASYWQSADITLEATNISAADSVRVSLYGRGTAADSPEVPLRAKNIPVPLGLQLHLDLSDIDANQYPLLRAEIDFFDTQFRTAPTLKHLYFNYGRLPDVAVNPLRRFAAPDSLARGETYTLSVGYENLSPQPMDSLLTRLRLIDENNQVATFFQRAAPVASRGEGSVDFQLPTAELGENLRVQLRLNPDDDQPESTLFNNDLNTRLKLAQDRVAPNLQVFFDGRRINDGDLVSAEPEILLQLRDDNPFLPLDDTSAYVLELQTPAGGRERIAFASPQVTFLPATESDNVAEIYFRPTLSEDGTYALMVRAADRSNNLAGRLEFRQTFEVINEQRVSNVLTYPNPFTTQTRFVYTLTGNEPPAVFRIQIMTVAGRVVRDIDLLAHETLKIGTHQTDFAWDGTDEYGGQLANGVYLYRVITSDNEGNTLKKQDTGTDRFFARNLGKVVILR